MFQAFDYFCKIFIDVAKCRSAFVSPTFCTFFLRRLTFFSNILRSERCALSGGHLPEALFLVFLLDFKGAKVCKSKKKCKSCRSRQEFSSYSNEYLLAKVGVDTTENGPLKVCPKLAKSQKKR